jgi:hypothetical protein
MIETIVAKLQALLAELFAMQLPIVKGDDVGAGALIRVRSGSYGDPYSGYSAVDSISLEGCAPLSLSLLEPERLADLSVRWNRSRVLTTAPAARAPRRLSSHSL